MVKIGLISVVGLLTTLRFTYIQQSGGVETYLVDLWIIEGFIKRSYHLKSFINEAYFIFKNILKYHCY